MQQLDQLDHLIMEALADLNKAPTTMERSDLQKIVNDWTQYSELISWSASELQVVGQTEESVQPVKCPEDVQNFQMEFSGLLKELGCPYGTIMDQSLGSRFDSDEKKKVLLNFLLSELQAARISYCHDTKPKQLKVELDESPTAKILREISMELGLGKPPDTITIPALWNNISGKVGVMLKSTGTLDPLFEGFLSPSQWSQVANYFGELTGDYEKRREMLLKRLDVTIQSFHWSDRLKGQKQKEIDEKFRKHRTNMASVPGVKLSDILAARIDLPIVEKTASASVRRNTKSAVNNVVIGRVPDRGGRTDEIQPPPPEMPPWQQRQGGGAPGTSGWIQGGQQQGGGGRGGGRGGGGNRGGGRVQGGWSDSGQRGGGGRSNNNYGNNQQQYDNRGNQQQYQQQYDNRGGGGGYHHQQQQYDNRGGGGGYHQQQGYNSGGGGGHYQHDNRSNDYYQNQQQSNYHQQDRNYSDQQHGGRRDNRYDDSRDNYRGGGGGRGGGRRY